MRTRVSWRMCWGRSLPLLLDVALLAGPTSAVSIDWVTVGDPGNVADTAGNCIGPGFGSASCGSVAEASTFMGSSAQGGITRTGSSGGFTYSVKPGFENKPVNFVSFYDSLRFTNSLNNVQGSGDTETGAYTLLGGTATPSNWTTVTRNAGANIFLPSENEWYKAAYWDPGTQSVLDFPAGSNTQTVCAAPGATANTANCGNVVGNVKDVGAFTGSASPNGTFDQGGNVWEWNEQIVSGSNRGIRGGSWNNNASNLAASNPNNNGATNENDNVGFRVASPRGAAHGAHARRPAAHDRVGPIAAGRPASRGRCPRRSAQLGDTPPSGAPGPRIGRAKPRARRGG